MPRHNSVHRTMDGKIKVCINTIEHTLTEPAFIEFMEQALNVMQAIAAQQKKGAS
jgi:hypothetical protein